MKHKPDYPEDLSVLARRGQLSSEQLDQLQRSLQGSATLRTADQVGRAFDRVAEVHQGDEQRIAQGVDRVMARFCAPPARPWRGMRLALVAAIVLGTTSAAGLVGFLYLPRNDSAPAQKATPGTAARTVGKGLHAVRHTGAEPTSAALPEDRGGTATEHAQADAPLLAGAEERPSRSSPVRETRTSSIAPSELFSSANAARRGGQPDRAIGLYLELQQAHPRSAEASMSYVTLGRMLLARGHAERALIQFSRYLKSHGPLEEEALLGKAQALAALGKTSEERAAWTALLTRYPSSVYAVEAKEHLGGDKKAQEP